MILYSRKDNPMPDWKEQLDNLLVLDKSLDGLVLPKMYLDKDLEDFISTQIIEKLINDIPDEDECCGCNLELHLKQQLRRNWL